MICDITWTVGARFRKQLFKTHSLNLNSRFGKLWNVFPRLSWRVRAVDDSSQVWFLLLACNKNLQPHRPVWSRWDFPAQLLAYIGLLEPKSRQIFLDNEALWRKFNSKLFIKKGFRWNWGWTEVVQCEIWLIFPQLLGQEITCDVDEELWSEPNQKETAEEVSERNYRH